MAPTAKGLVLTTLTAAFCLAGCSSDSSMPTGLEPSFSRGTSTTTDPTATWMLPLADAGLALASDGQYSDGTYSVYANGVCGVSATIFATTQKSNTGDAVIQTNSSTRGKSCGRTFTLRYPDGFSETVPSFNNLRALQNTTTIIPVGATVKRLLILNPGALVTGSRCDRLLFGVGDNPDNGAGSDSVLVTRETARQWHVQSDPQSSELAWCQKTGELFTMPVDFVIVASYDLPQ